MIKAKMIKLYPTKEQKLLLKKWFDDARCTYNLALENIQEKGLRPWNQIRDDVVTKTRYYCSNCDAYPGRSNLCKRCGLALIKQENTRLSTELTNTPKHIRLEQVKRLNSSYKTAFTNLKRGNIKHFKMNFKSKKKLVSDSIEIEKTSFKLVDNACTIYSNTFQFVKSNKKIKRKTLKQIPTEIKYNTRICYNYIHKEYFLSIPVDQEIKNYNFKENKIIALDPGVKTLLSGYDAQTGNSIILNNRVELLHRLKRKIAKLQANNKRIDRVYKRFNHIINDNQNRICNYLVKNYDVIFLPKFESQKLKMKSKAYNFKHLNMNKHYQLQQKLLWFSLKHSKKTLIVDESYTTKTCGLCGTINNTMTLADRSFNCIDKNCSYRNIDRDYNGARNILIKTLVEM